MPCWSLGQAVTAMVGQNTGAGAMDRVRKITRTGLWCGLSSTLILLLLVHRFSLPILQLFGSDSPEVLSARGSLLSDLLRRQQPVLHCHVPP